jgi:hypothetical protein
MSEVLCNYQTLTERLHQVESQNRRIWAVCLILGTLTIIPWLIFGLWQGSSAKVITAGKVLLVDEKGTTRLKMELNSGIPRITLDYDNGDPCVSISGTELCFYDHGRKSRISINPGIGSETAGVSISDKEGKNIVSLNAGPEGPYLSFDDRTEHKEVVLSIDPIGTLNALEGSSGRGEK